MPKRPAVTQPIGRTGNASVMKQGQTTDGRHGSNPDAKVKGNANVRDLSAK